MSPSTREDGRDGIRMLGREMLTWSDASAGPGAVRGPVAARLAGALVTAAAARTLVVGPHEAEVIRAVAEGSARTDVLVRSLPDAEALRAELPPEVTISCGPLDRFDAPAPYDLVVALAGPHRLHTAEQAAPDWPDTLDRLTDLVADRGRLLLGLPNPLGLARLLALEVGRGRDDHDWPSGRVAEEVDPGRTALVGHLRDCGLEQRQEWACFGTAYAVGLAVSTDVLANRTGDRLLEELGVRAARSAAVTFARDPGPPVREALRHGLGPQLASSWALLLERGGNAPAPSTALLAGVGSGLVELWPVDDGWRARADRERVLAAVPSLATLLADALAAHDVAAAGGLVRRYRDWLEGRGATSCPVVEPGDLLVGDDDFVALDTPDGPGVDPATALARGVLAFAVDLTRADGRHPWRDSSDEDVLARRLLATAGIEDADDLIAAARALPGELARPTPRPAYDSVLREVEDLRRQLREADIQIRWLLRNIHIRERRVRAANRRTAQLRRSAEYRVGSRLLRGRRALGRLRSRLRRDPPADSGQAQQSRRRWQDPATRASNGPVPLEVDPDLLPPGYTVDGDTI